MSEISVKDTTIELCNSAIPGEKFPSPLIPEGLKSYEKARSYGVGGR